MSFPDSFVWGVATSSYQIEGAARVNGRGPTIWDTFCAQPGTIADGSSGFAACDHYHLMPADVALMKSLGVKGYRFSTAWSRMFPYGDERREPRGFDFYDRLIDELLENDIEPMLTLYHWDLPQPLQDAGGWPDRGILRRFADYAYAVGEHFGDRVTHFSPINEPWVVSWLGYGTGHHAPGIADRSQAVAAAHHTVVAHRLATEALNATAPSAQIGPVLNQSLPMVDDITDPFQMRAAAQYDTVQNRFWMEGILRGRYPKIAFDTLGDDLSRVIRDDDLQPVLIDWLGVNYYNNARVGHRRLSGDVDPGDWLETGATITPQGPLTDMGWSINPQGIGDLLVRWHREYGSLIPRMRITENGCAYDDGVGNDGSVHDERRISYLREHLLSVERAIEAGAPVDGYYQWSLMDNFEWAFGYEKRFGIVHVDFHSLNRTVKDSGYWYSLVIASNGASLAV
jgi:beta-glucosidase